MNRLEQLDHRLQRVERYNRLLLAVVIVMSGLGVVACATHGAYATPGKIRTQGLQIVDSDGLAMIELGKIGEGFGIVVRDPDRNSRAALRHDKQETGLFIKDVAGDSRVGIAHFAHGGSGVALHGPQLRGAAVLYYKNRGTLSFYDPEGTVLERVPAKE